MEKRKRSTLGTLLIEPFRQWSEDHASTLAAALAYYTVMSIAPLVVVIVLIAGYFFQSGNALNQLTTQISRFTSPQVGSFIGSLVKNAHNPASGGLLSSIISIAVLIFGASGIFLQLQSSLNRIWNVSPKANTGIKKNIWNHVLSFLLVIGLGILFILFIAADAILTQFLKVIPGTQNALVAQIINGVVLFGIITAIIAMIFRVVPDREIQWSDVWLGAAVTALLFLVGRYAIGIFLSFSKTASNFGAAGSLIVLLLWIYYSAQIFFFGAEFTQVYAETVGSHRNVETVNPESKTNEPGRDRIRTAAPQPIPITGEDRSNADPNTQLEKGDQTDSQDTSANTQI